MTRLILAATIFLLAHLTSSTPLRAIMVRALGRNGYLVLYSATAFAALGWTGWAYYRAPFVQLWYEPALRYAPLVAMPLAFLFLACGVLTPNPTAVSQERLLDGGHRPRGIQRITRHPVMWGIALWAGSHILARGDAAALVFFGSFLLLALVGTNRIDRRKGAAPGNAWQPFRAQTSNVPFLAVLTARNRIVPSEIGWLQPLVGIGLCAAAFFSHAALFGARPI